MNDSVLPSLLSNVFIFRDASSLFWVKRLEMLFQRRENDFLCCAAKEMFNKQCIAKHLNYWLSWECFTRVNGGLAKSLSSAFMLTSTPSPYIDNNMWNESQLDSFVVSSTSQQSRTFFRLKLDTVIIRMSIHFDSAVSVICLIIFTTMLSFTVF